MGMGKLVVAPDASVLVWCRHTSWTVLWFCGCAHGLPDFRHASPQTWRFRTTFVYDLKLSRSRKTKNVAWSLFSSGFHPAIDSCNFLLPSSTLWGVRKANLFMFSCHFLEWFLDHAQAWPRICWVEFLLICGCQPVSWFLYESLILCRDVSFLEALWQLCNTANRIPRLFSVIFPMDLWPSCRCDHHCASCGCILRVVLPRVVA